MLPVLPCLADVGVLGGALSACVTCVLCVLLCVADVIDAWVDGVCAHDVRCGGAVGVDGDMCMAIGLLMWCIYGVCLCCVWPHWWCVNVVCGGGMGNLGVCVGICVLVGVMPCGWKNVRWAMVMVQMDGMVTVSVGLFCGWFVVVCGGCVCGYACCCGCVCVWLVCD